MKFIHIADVHLGAVPDLGYAWSGLRAKEIWESLTRVMEQVKKEKVELLLVAGDLFHGQPLMRECRELNYLWEQIPDTAVVLIAGNHDHIQKESAYLKTKWAKNVIGLWGENCQSCYLENCNTYVYGMSYHSREIETPVYNRVFPGGSVNLRKERPDAHHILLAHGGDEKHIPIHFSALAETDFDYIALGHIHIPQILAAHKMAYAGALEPGSKNQTGPRGYIRGEIENGTTTIEFVPFSIREYRNISIQVNGTSSNRSIADAIQSVMKKQGSHHIYRIFLEGQRDPDLEIQAEQFTGLGNIVEITDLTEPELDFAELRLKYAGTAVAAYIDGFCGRKQMLTEVERKALSYGVQALIRAGE